MTVDDFSGIAKFMRATNPTWSNAQVAEYMRREGPPRHDGGPVTDGYVGRMLVREKVINRMNARLRKKRLLAARQRGRHTRAEWLDMIAVFKGRCVGCGRKDRPVTKDHIIPLCEDGSSDGIENLQPLCLPCNARRGNTWTAETKQGQSGRPSRFRRSAPTLGRQLRRSRSGSGVLVARSKTGSRAVVGPM